MYWVPCVKSRPPCNSLRGPKVEMLRERWLRGEDRSSSARGNQPARGDKPGKRAKDLADHLLAPKRAPRPCRGKVIEVLGPLERSRLLGPMWGPGGIYVTNWSMRVQD